MAATSAVRAFSIQDSDLHWCRLAAAGKAGTDWSHWLMDTGSLTARLKSLSGGLFSVRVLAEDWCCIESTRLRALFAPLGKEHRFWSRQVALLGEGRPWVLAHTLIPEFSLTGPLREVIGLAQRPLGEYLFGQPALKRSGLDITPTVDGWARRSTFYLHQKPIMVAESFLPALLAAAAAHDPALFVG